MRSGFGVKFFILVGIPVSWSIIGQGHRKTLRVRMGPENSFIPVIEVRFLLLLPSPGVNLHSISKYFRLIYHNFRPATLTLPCHPIKYDVCTGKHQNLETVGYQQTFEILRKVAYNNALHLAVSLRSEFKSFTVE